MIDKELKTRRIVRDVMHAQICPKVCISMEADEEGFLYPTVDYNFCIKCKKCVDVCPIINKIEVDNNPVAYSA